VLLLLFSVGGHGLLPLHITSHSLLASQLRGASAAQRLYIDDTSGDVMQLLTCPLRCAVLCLLHHLLLQGTGDATATCTCVTRLQIIRNILFNQAQLTCRLCRACSCMLCCCFCRARATLTGCTPMSSCACASRDDAAWCYGNCCLPASILEVLVTMVCLCCLICRARDTLIRLPHLPKTSSGMMLTYCCAVPAAACCVAVFAGRGLH
jgi:hypothetical protein